MEQYYKLQEVQHTADADLFDEDYMEDLTIDAYDVHENVLIVGTREVDVVCYADGCTEVTIVQAQVGADGCLYLECSEAEELLG